jgi:hypothetical protein
MELLGGGQQRGDGGRGEKTPSIQHWCRKHCTKWCQNGRNNGGLECRKDRLSTRRIIVRYTSHISSIDSVANWRLCLCLSKPLSYKCTVHIPNVLGLTNGFPWSRSLPRYSKWRSACHIFTKLEMLCTVAVWLRVTMDLGFRDHWHIKSCFESASQMPYI